MKVVASAAESKSPKQNDSVASEIPEQGRTATGSPQDTPTHNSLTVNKRFVVNTLKQVDDHNRIKTNQESKLLRKFQNEERKKHTLKNLDTFSPQRTLYSDFFGGAVADKKTNKRKRTQIITPLEQVKKLVTDAADFDDEQENMLKRVVRKPRFSVDKRLLNNHLQHHSVHNRLKEEEEMWDKHKSEKKRKVDDDDDGVQTKSSKRTSSGVYGGMYADREPGNVKVTRVKETPDEPSPRFGRATRELLDLEESMPDRWDHSGFKDIYEEEIFEDDDDDDELDDEETDTPRSKPSRNIIISNRITDRLNSSIELSDDDVEIIPLSKVRKLGSRVVVNKLKRNKKISPRKIVTVNKPISVEAMSMKKSVITVAPKTSKVKIDKSRKTKPIKPVRKKEKKVEADRTKMGTLQADLIITEEKSRKGMKRAVSPKWGHDRYQEINDDGDDDDDDGGDCAEPVRKSAKSRLNVVNVIERDEDSEVSIDFPKVNLKRKELIEVKKKKINQTSNTKNVSSGNTATEMCVQLSDSDEWTEKEVSQTLPKNDARRKLKQNKNDAAGVNRVTLKNSIHEEKGTSIQSRQILSAQQQQQQQQSKKINNNNKGSLNGDQRKGNNQSEKKRTSSENRGDSSFTDSSGDERYRKKVDVKKQRLMRNRKFYNESRSKHQ